jgi:hypothetical protein
MPPPPPPPGAPMWFSIGAILPILNEDIPPTPLPPLVSSNMVPRSLSPPAPLARAMPESVAAVEASAAAAAAEDDEKEEEEAAALPPLPTPPANFAPALPPPPPEELLLLLTDRFSWGST